MEIIRKLIIFIFIFIAFTSSNVWSQFVIDVRATGTTAASFLEIGIGARALGIGGAYTAVSNDPTALYYNPAGIVWIEGAQVEFMHNEWFVGTNHNYLGAVMALPFLNSSIGLSLNSLSYDDQPVRTIRRPEGTGETYNSRDIAVGLTFAMALTDRFSFGLTGKWISQRIWHESGDAVALDLGIFYETPVDGLNLGFSMSNFGTDIQLRGRELDSTTDPDLEHSNIDRVRVEFKTDPFPLPILFRAGISYYIYLDAFGSFLIAADLLHPSNNRESINVGAEYGFLGLFFIRGGYENLFEEYSVNGLTLGAGIDYYRPGQLGIRVDYAYSDWGILDSSHRFSIGVSFP